MAAYKHPERWTKSSLTEIITVWGRLYIPLRTWISYMEKNLDMIPKTGIREFRNPIPSRSHQPQRGRNAYRYDLTSAFKELASNTRRPQSRKSKRKLYKGIITYQWTTGTATKEFLPFFSLSVEIYVYVQPMTDLLPHIFPFCFICRCEKLRHFPPISIAFGGLSSQFTTDIVGKFSRW